MLSGARVLVTGGTGSFGHHITQALLDAGVAEVRIFSRDEKKQWDMRREFENEPRLHFYIGDVRDLGRVRQVIRDIDLVYHAAALKQVPGCERHPMEAVKTNVVGAENVLQAAVEAGVQRFVTISTDKAVKPVNAMGMSKALQERLVLSLKHTDLVATCVRYGNVVGSRGSVVPLFKELLEKGRDLPITDPRMTRFLLTLDEAIELVFTATREGKGREIFVRKMPGALITDLAEVMIEGLTKGEPKWFEAGIRPGEKIHEVLVSSEEMRRSRENDHYFIVEPYPEDAVTDDWRPSLTSHRNPEEYTSENTLRLRKPQIRDLLKGSGWL